ncbi:MAG: ABC transporter permease [Anaerolineales bacterium]|nr:ABC transporter permease [Anaerolineales bacterium]
MTTVEQAATSNNLKRETQLSLAWRQFKRHKLAVFGLCVLPIFILVAVFGNWIMPYDPNAVAADGVIGMPQPPSRKHLLGVDLYGRDMVSRLISGAQISLSVGFVSVGIALIIGLILGSLAGFYGGIFDTLITRLADIFLSLPRLFLIMIVNSYLPPNIYNVMVVIGLFSWMNIARLVRGEILKIKTLDYIHASTALGASSGSIILTHMLPNAFAPVIVATTIGIPYAILLESALSFLGLGVMPPQASWGNILYEARQWISVAWWYWVPPGVLISLTVLCFNFIGDGLRDAFDPTLRGK